MLSATQRDPQKLELVRLVLELISTQESKIPLSLKQSFDTVLAQAKQLAVDPRSVTEEIIAESVDLAYEITAIAPLAKHIKNVTSCDSISPDLAKRLLDSIESVEYQSAP